jgi:hypothetical protein
MSTTPRVFQHEAQRFEKHGRYISMRAARWGLRSAWLQRNVFARRQASPVRNSVQLAVAAIRSIRRGRESFTR